MGLPEALAGQNDLPGVVVAPALMRRLQLNLGDIMQLGEQEFVVMATLEKEPDNFGNFALGPRSIVLAQDLEGSGLLSQGTIFSSKYRLILPNGADFDKVKAVFETDWATAGGKWKDARNASPGAARAIDRLSTFLVLIGLSGLVVGGIGVSAAVRAFVAKKTGNIAVLKTLGATPRQIFWIYTLQIIAYTVVAVILGVLLGAVAPFLARPFLPESLSAVAVISVYPGCLVRSRHLWRIGGGYIFDLALGANRANPPSQFISRRHATKLASRALRHSSGDLTGRSSLGRGPILWIDHYDVLVAWGHFTGPALFGFDGRAIPTDIETGGAQQGPSGAPCPPCRRKRNCQWHRTRRPGRNGYRAGLGGSGGGWQIDGNLRNSMTKSLPDKAPSFFFLDIQSGQLDEFNQRLSDNTEVDRVETAPMLRGLVTQINGKPAAEVGGDHWVLRGDRGISYAAGMPEKTSLTAGQWWPDDYSGPAQISFSAEAAEEIGISLGDSLTLNVLGRDITATITSLRDVDFSNAGMGFVILLNAAALAGAPHSHIATVYASEAAEIPILDELGQAFPNVTGIQIREAVLMVSGIVSSIASAASIGAIATLITGFLILIGAASASSEQRAYETAILKTLGATRREILVSFALRSAMVGALAASVALGAGLLGGWAVSNFVFESSFEVIWSNAALIILGGVGATLITGVLFALGPLSQSAAAELRHRD